jgi:hypothetical protein
MARANDNLILFAAMLGPHESFVAQGERLGAPNRRRF